MFFNSIKAIIQPLFFHSKPKLMDYRTIFIRLIIFIFICLVGYILARSIYNKNALGVVLALISLVATVYCIQLLAKAKQEAESETDEIR